MGARYTLGVLLDILMHVLHRVLCNQAAHFYQIIFVEHALEYTTSASLNKSSMNTVEVALVKRQKNITWPGG